MQKNKQLSPLRWRLAFFVLTIIIFFLIPPKSSGGFIDGTRTYWPFRLMSDKTLFILSNYRIWFIGQWIAFAGVLLFLEPFSWILEIRKNKTVKIVVFILFFLCFLPLIYFSAGSTRYLGPLPPMTFDFWLKWFAAKRNFLYIWWILSGLFLQIGTKL